MVMAAIVIMEMVFVMVVEVMSPVVVAAMVVTEKVVAMVVMV